jgi:membrane protease YdiL (CAAX protease family)
MMFPGSFIWRRISDEWLMSKAASVLFAISSGVIALVTAALLSGVLLAEDSSAGKLLWAIAGSSCGIGIFFLWGGMWRYWMKGKPPNRVARRIWFVLMVVGVWYGAVLYYIFVYLPSARKSDRERFGAAEI